MCCLVCGGSVRWGDAMRRCGVNALFCVETLELNEGGTNKVTINNFHKQKLLLRHTIYIIKVPKDDYK